MRSPHAKRRLYPVAQDDDLTGQFIKKEAGAHPAGLVAEVVRTTLRAFHY
ncbi:hypothetical protein [Laceyella sediminis]|jgi:hypothetical protein|nr:hypothetical protein [Laceyella sediminis]